MHCCAPFIACCDCAPSIARLLQACGADIINMSYGEPAARPDVGRVIEVAADAVHKAGIIFVASAGNAGAWARTCGYMMVSAMLYMAQRLHDAVQTHNTHTVCVVRTSRLGPLGCHKCIPLLPRASLCCCRRRQQGLR